MLRPQLSCRRQVSASRTTTPQTVNRTDKAAEATIKDDGKLVTQETTTTTPTEKIPNEKPQAKPSPKPHHKPTESQTTSPAQLITINSDKKGNETLLKETPKYIKAIFDPADLTFPRLECPLPLSSLDRYAYLKAPPRAPAVTTKPKYFFTLDLWNTVELLPRLLGSIVEAVRFLGPENCVLSVVEGRSNDGTFEILKEISKDFEKMGLRYILSTNEVNPKSGDVNRIEALANLRNLALEDLWKNPDQYEPDTMVIFSNDVALCFDDILEIIHQKLHQQADMMCAMDWLNRDPFWFYDLWVARGINGDSFLEITPKTKDEKGEEVGAKFQIDQGLFWNDNKTRERYEAYKSFQVFACWNGIVSFTAKPIMEKKIKFRSTDGQHGHECYQSEPNLFAKDLWYHGFGKIAVAPTINVAYSTDEAREVRKKHGYVSQRLTNADDKIEWQKNPPEKVMCLPDIDGPHLWKPWNEKLPGAAEEKET